MDKKAEIAQRTIPDFLVCVAEEFPRLFLQPLDEEAKHEQQVAQTHSDEADSREARNHANGQQHADHEYEDGDPNSYFFRRIDSHEKYLPNKFLMIRFVV
jgi:hypothetical protein